MSRMAGMWAVSEGRQVMRQRTCRLQCLENARAPYELGSVALIGREIIGDKSQEG